MRRLLLSLVVFFRLTAGCLLENGMSSVYLSVFEDAPKGSTVGKLPLKPAADGEELSLRVVKGNDLIEVDQQTKVLTLTQELDRDEGNSKFESVIECRSSNSESDFGQLNISVFVTVKDVNDNAPEFDEDQYNVTISEELPVGTIVFTDFEATDRDQPGPNSFVQYSIVPSKYSHLLEIADPFKPAISIKNRIDYEKIREFSVEIEAKDQGDPSQATRAPLHVTVVDANDLNPVFKHQFYTAIRVKNGELVLDPESISAVDGDSLQAEMVYSLDGDLSEQFSIDGRGIIRVRSDPPPMRATLIVRVHEKEHPERNASAVVRVDLGPKLHFRHRTYSAKVQASLPVGSPLFIVEALSDKGAKVRYSLSGDPSLGIDLKTGEISVRGPLQAGEQSWNVTATASGESISTPLTLVVDKTPEPHKLEFEKSEYQLQIGSLPILGTIRIRGEGKATFKLMNMNREFLIDPSGIVRLKPGAKPTCSSCELIVVATDEEGGSSIARVIVKNTAYTQEMSSATVMTIVALFALFGIVIVIIVFLLKQVKSAWRARRRSNICWMNTSNDTGVTITGTLPTPSRYVVNSAEKAYESAKSPAPKRAQGAQLVPVTVSQDGGPPTVYF